MGLCLNNDFKMNPNSLTPSEGSFCNADAIELSVYPELASTSAYFILQEKGLVEEATEMLQIMHQADELVLSPGFKAIEHAAEGQPESLGVPPDIPAGSRLTWVGLHLARYADRGDFEPLRQAVKMCAEIQVKIATHRQNMVAN